MRRRHGRGGEAWEWRGPEYEWPDAGWISEGVARAFIATAYDAWRRRAERSGQDSKYRRRNGFAQEELNAIRFAVLLEQRMGEEAASGASEELLRYASELNARRETAPPPVLPTDVELEPSTVA